MARDLAAEVGDDLDREVARGHLQAIDADAADQAARRRRHRTGDDDLHARRIRPFVGEPEPAADVLGEALEPDPEPVGELTRPAGAFAALIRRQGPHQRVEQQDRALGEEGLQHAEPYGDADQGLVGHDRGGDAPHQGAERGLGQRDFGHWTDASQRKVTTKARAGSRHRLPPARENQRSRGGLLDLHLGDDLVRPLEEAVVDVVLADQLALLARS